MRARGVPIHTGVVFFVVVLGCGRTEKAGIAPHSGAAASPDSGGLSSSPGQSSSEGGAGGEGRATGNAGAPDLGMEQSLLPWRIGNSWTYRVTKPVVTTEKTTTVGSEEPVPGTLVPDLVANLVTTRESNGDVTESWQGRSPENPKRIVRFGELDYGASSGTLEQQSYYMPEKLHLDETPERMLTGATWVEAYEESILAVGDPPWTESIQERWTVVDDNETLTVPAGTFEGVIHLQKTMFTPKDYWYARGIGKVKEVGMQTEELVDYHLEP